MKQRASLLRPHLLVLIVLGITGYGASSGTVTAGQDSAETTVWSGVYTEAQAARGAEIYNKKCGYCHRVDLSGGEVGPPLKGAPYLVRWAGPISKMFFKIGNAMPQDAPATLEPANVVDLLAHILKQNSIPAGKTELPADETLDRIQVSPAP